MKIQKPVLDMGLSGSLSLPFFDDGSFLLFSLTDEQLIHLDCSLADEFVSRDIFRWEVDLV